MLNGASSRDYLEQSVVLDVTPPSNDLNDPTMLREPYRTVSPGQVTTLMGVANESGAARPSHPRDLAIGMDVFTDTNVWLGLPSIGDDDEGVTAAWLGDFNNDRMADLVVGLPASIEHAGRVYILDGRAGDWTLPPDVESLDGGSSVLIGADNTAGLGTLLAAVGDVDGDGFDDLLVGEKASERAFLVYGRPGPVGQQTLETGQQGSISALKAPDTITWLASAGDVNGDSRADILATSGGTTYLLDGLAPQQQRAANLIISAGTAVEGPAGSQLWPAAATWSSTTRAVGLGNVDGDAQNLSEIATVGSTSDGNALVSVYANSGTVSAAYTATRNMESSGVLVTPLGDVNGDGRADFAITYGGVHDLLLGQQSLSFASAREDLHRLFGLHRRAGRRQRRRNQRCPAGHRRW